MPTDEQDERAVDGQPGVDGPRARRAPATAQLEQDGEADAAGDDRQHRSGT